MMEVGPKYAEGSGMTYDEYKREYAKESMINRLEQRRGGGGDGGAAGLRCRRWHHRCAVERRRRHRAVVTSGSPFTRVGSCRLRTKASEPR